MKKYNVGILGATGAVGREMLKVLEERKFPIRELKLFASERSVGKKMIYGGKEYKVELADFGAFRGLDFVLGAAANPVAKKFAKDIVDSGAVFIDNSSAFRMEEDVPLVVPEINPEDAFLHHGIIANPNCSTIITLVAIHAIQKLADIKALIASTYQATSGAGAEGPIELRKQMKSLLENGEISPQVFPYQIAENVIPHIGSFLGNGYTTEEMKMQNEGRKIMHLPDLKVTCTCVRVPVARSHSISVTILCDKPLEVEQVKQAISKENGCRLYDDVSNKVYPMPIVTSDQDLVYVGRIRKDLIFENGIDLWCCGDQVRKGAATNAVQIAMILIGLNI